MPVNASNITINGQQPKDNNDSGLRLGERDNGLLLQITGGEQHKQRARKTVLYLAGERDSIEQQPESGSPADLLGEEHKANKETGGQPDVLHSQRLPLQRRYRFVQRVGDPAVHGPGRQTLAMLDQVRSQEVVPGVGHPGLSRSHRNLRPERVDQQSGLADPQQPPHPAVVSEDRQRDQLERPRHFQRAIVSAAAKHHQPLQRPPLDQELPLHASAGPTADSQQTRLRKLLPIHKTLRAEGRHHRGGPLLRPGPQPQRGECQLPNRPRRTAAHIGHLHQNQRAEFRQRQSLDQSPQTQRSRISHPARHQALLQVHVRLLHHRLTFLPGQHSQQSAEFYQFDQFHSSFVLGHRLRYLS